MPVILVVDDEPLQREILKTILEDAGHETITAASGEEALKLAEKYLPDIMLTDLKMEGMDGIELISTLSESATAPTMIIMTAHGTIPTAVEAIKKGAFDYLAKPLDKETLLLTVGRAAERAGLLRENRLLQKELYDKFRMEGIVGRSGGMQQALEIMRKVSDSPATVLITGESGTGKELIARAIHYNSQRRTKPFTALNCAAIPENLFESELFGYEPGAFTGASSRRIGLFEASNGGTLFLDEIGDMPQLMQSKLLRVIQDKEVRRLGGKDPIRIDVRIITATNKDLMKELQKGTFREDLFYRLKVVTIGLPPLRERKEDIPALAEFFIAKYNREFGKRITGIDAAALRAFGEYGWPGNIRQLESVIERAVIMADADRITLSDIRSELRISEPSGSFSIELPDEGISFDELEKDLLKKAMQKSNGVVAKAAKLLGMSYKTFWYRWEKLQGRDASRPSAD
ncbi:MAG: sigma-54 dependent transcriptional regulator [Thermodesulfovibrionales bacterium]